MGGNMQILTWITENTLVALALAVVVAIVCRFSRQRPALCHALWVLVLIRLLAPPLPWATPISTLIHPITHANVAATHVVAEPYAETLVSPHAAQIPASTHLTPINESASGPFEYVKPVPVPEVKWSIPFTVPTALMASWLMGMILIWAVQSRRIWRMGRVLSLGFEPQQPFMQVVKQLSSRLSMDAPRVRMVQRVGSPFIWALGKPQLVWPSWQEEQIGNPGQKAVLAHELAHIRRHDHWTRWFELFSMGLLWWHPFFWFIRRQIREYAELSCDAWAIHAFPTHRKALAHALLDAAERGFHPSKVVTAMGATAAGRRQFKRRLTMIIQNKSAHRVSAGWLAALCCCLLFVLSGWTTLEPVTELPAAPSELSDIDPRIESIARAQIALTMGKRYMNGERWDDAVAAFEEALRFLPNNEHASWSLSHAALEAGRPDIAERTLMQIKDRKNDHDNWSMQMAQALAAQGKQQAALNHLRDAVESAQINAEIFVDPVFEALADDSEFNHLMRQSLKLSKLKHDKKKEENQRQTLREILEIAPRSASTWGRLGYVSISEGDLAEAEKAFRQQLELDPESSTAAYNMACTFSKSGNLSEANQWLQKAVALGWDDDEHIVQDSDLDAIRETSAYREVLDQLSAETQLGHDIKKAHKHEDHAKVSDLLLEAEKLGTLDDDDKAWIVKHRASTNYHQKQYAEASEAYIEHLATSDHADVDSTLYNIACCKSLNGEIEQAFAYLTVAIEAGFDSADHIRHDSDLDALHDDARFDQLVLRAAQVDLLAAFGSDTWDTFMRDFDSRLTSGSFSKDQIKNISWSLYNGEQWDLAARAFAHLREKGDNRTAAYNAACCYAQAQNADQAFAWLKRALADGFDDVHHIRKDKDLASLRADERFEKFIAAIDHE